MNSFISRDASVDDVINVEELMNNPDIALISDDISTREELAKAINKYVMLSRRDKRFSDYYSVQLYGANVYNMFLVMKDHLKSDFPSIIGETVLVSEPDLYYNKDAFDDGRVNLCFVIGYSGSGKSVLTREYEGEGIEKVELDDIVCVKDHYTMEQLKEMGVLLHSFFEGVGSKYYISREERTDTVNRGEVFVEFIKYAIDYAEHHKDSKFILEGIWTYLYFDDPSLFNNYAVFMKGTSLIKSKLRRIKRESVNGAEKTVNKILEFGIYMNDSMMYDKNVDIWRHHFEKMPGTVQKTEDNRRTEIRQNIMSEIYDINDAFVHGDKAAIEAIKKRIGDSKDITLTERNIINEECRRALADME